MFYRHFRVQIILRVVFLSISIFALFLVLTRTTLIATSFILAILIFFQIVGLIHYVEKTNQLLSRFLEAIRYSDFSQSFSAAGWGASFDQLMEAFTAVMKDFQAARAEKEEQHRYLETVVQHVGIGLIAFLPNGDVELLNSAAKKILQINQLRNIHSLVSISDELVHTLMNLRSGRKALVRIQDEESPLQLAIYATSFKMRNRNVKLVSLQNIQSELEEREFEAWQKLIRVLTHEIMNSVTPISSLAATMNELLGEECDQGGAMALKPESITDIRGAARTIQHRSEGLIHFVEAYRKLTRLPKPQFSIVSIKELFAHVQQLLGKQFLDTGVQFEYQVCPEALEVTADPELIEQVLINLLKNAMEAVNGRRNATVKLIAEMDPRGRTLIRVEDNGPGIIGDAKDKIFIPFYTTKKEGSGIGLSLSRQIMRLHRGTITVQSEPEVKTVFTLRF